MAVRTEIDGTMRPVVQANVTPIDVARARRADRGEAEAVEQQYDALLRDQLLLGPSKKGRAPILPLLFNARFILEFDRRWWSKIAWDDFRGDVVVRGPVPIQHAPGEDWSDDAESRVKEWLQRTWDVDVKILDVRAAVRLVAMNARYHSVRDYLEKLRWDGTPRLDRFLVTHMSCEEGPWAELVGPKWMISAVARAYKPGCKVDTMLVLEGEQSRLKSTAVQVLAGDGNFAMELADIGSRDAAQQLQGVWLYEIEEMHAFATAKVERVKQFISQPFDRHVGKWRVHAERIMRGCVFIGTTNRIDYLNDPTGGRRFWPVRVLRQIDIEKLKTDRDQLWAEAVSRFKAGERWYLQGDEETLAKAEQEARQSDHQWIDDVKTYLEDKSWCLVQHVLMHVLGGSRDRWGDRETKAVVDCLLRLGWTRQRDSGVGEDGMRAWRWRPKVAKVAAVRGEGEEK